MTIDKFYIIIFIRDPVETSYILYSWVTQVYVKTINLLISENPLLPTNIFCIPTDFYDTQKYSTYSHTYLNIYMHVFNIHAIIFLCKITSTRKANVEKKNEKYNGWHRLSLVLLFSLILVHSSLAIHAIMGTDFTSYSIHNLLHGILWRRLPSIHQKFLPPTCLQRRALPEATLTFNHVCS